MKALSTRNDAPEQASRPFDKDRDGFVMGEGSGIVVLESLEHALARNATIYAEVVGYGTNADAYHMTAPAPEGAKAAECMNLALKDAGVAPEAVDYINAHGTSTPMNDKNETLAIKSLFGEHAKKLAISSIKSMTGHLLGAAGGIEVIATALTIKNSPLNPEFISFLTMGNEVPHAHVHIIPRSQNDPIQPVLSSIPHLKLSEEKFLETKELLKSK